MPYRLHGAPATSQIHTDKVLSPDLEPIAFCYLDDICTNDFDRYLEILPEVLSHLLQAYLTINFKKK